MKRPTRSIGLFLAATVGGLAVVPSLSAQDFDDDMDVENESSFEVRAGASVPGGDLDNYFDPGFSVGLGYTMPLNERLSFELEGDVGFLSDIVEDEELGTGEVRQFFDGDMRLWHYGVGLQLDAVDPATSDVSVIVHGGLGATTIDPERTFVIEGGTPPVFSDASTRTRFTVNGGLSLGFGVAEDVDLLVDAKTYGIFLKDEDYEAGDVVDDAIGESWWTIPVSAMIRFRAP